MERHYRLTVARLPGNVEADLARLQSIAFELTGAIASVALPPLVPLAARTAVESRPDHPTVDRPCADDPSVGRAERRVEPPCPLSSPLTIGGAVLRGATLCLGAGLSPARGHPPTDADAWPRGLPAGACAVVLASDVHGEHALDEEHRRLLVDETDRAWSRLCPPGRQSVTVRSVMVQEWYLHAFGEPWWERLDWRVLSSRWVRLKGD